MPLHPQSQAILDHFAKVLTPYYTMEPADAKAQYDRIVADLNMPAPEVARVEDRQIDGWKHPITVRIYWPAGAEREHDLPITLFAHGGGFVLGSLNSHDPQCRAIANTARSIVVAVDYTKGPDGRFPMMQEDSYAALTWVAANAGNLGGDAGRIAVCGDSAGGVIAAALPQMSRERGGPKLVFQALVYPGIDRFTPVPSHELFTTGKFLTKELTDWYRSLYWPQDDDSYDPRDIRLSPGQQTDLSGLPPALIITVGADPLRDEGLRYAERLSDAGIAATYICYWGHIHGCWVWSGRVGAGMKMTQEVSSALAEAFWGPHAAGLSG
jgi:acetyl esterase